MTDITTVAASGGISSGGAAAAAAPKQTLDKEAFLQLLVTQLRYQDPSSPMDSNELMAQQTQLATVEQLTELTTTQRESFGLQMRVSAASMVGQTVSWLDKSGAIHSGVVASVSFAGSVPTVRVGDTEIDLNLISAVASTQASAA